MTVDVATVPVWMQWPLPWGGPTALRSWPAGWAMSAPSNGSSQCAPDLGAAGSRVAVAASRQRGKPVEPASECLAPNLTEKHFNTRVMLISREASLDKLWTVDSKQLESYSEELWMVYLGFSRQIEEFILQ